MFRNRASRDKGLRWRSERGGVPVSIVVKHGVEHHEEFAEAGGKSRFRIFPASSQLSVKNSG